MHLAFRVFSQYNIFYWIFFIFNHGSPPLTIYLLKKSILEYGITFHYSIIKKYSK